MSDPFTIYLRLPNWVGDACMSLPALETVLNTGRPTVVCARPWAADLLAAYPLAGFVPLSGHWRADQRAVAQYRRAQGQRTARGILLPDSLSSALIFRLAGIASAGHRDDGRSPLLRWPVDKPAQALHAVQAWHRLACAALRAWDLPAQPAEAPKALGLRLPDAAQVACETVLREAGLLGHRFILVAPTAVGRHRGRDKVWPQFDRLVRALQAQGHTVVMCPPAAERAQALRNAPTAQCLPPVGLATFATLTRKAALVVCNDSGVSHLAAAVGARQLTLFGVTEHARTGPWSDQAHCLGSAQGWPDFDGVSKAVRRLLADEPFDATAWTGPHT